MIPIITKVAARPLKPRANHHSNSDAQAMENRAGPPAQSERLGKVSRREQLEEMLESDPDDVFLRYALAMQYVSEGDSAAGIERLQQVIDHAPKYVAAYFQKGQLLAQEDEIDSAKEILTRGTEVAREVGDTHAEGEMTDFLETL